jgi:hypothetical protein
MSIDLAGQRKLGLFIPLLFSFSNMWSLFSMGRLCRRGRPSRSAVAVSGGRDKGGRGIAATINDYLAPSTDIDLVERTLAGKSWDRGDKMGGGATSSLYPHLMGDNSLCRGIVERAFSFENGGVRGKRIGQHNPVIGRSQAAS